MADFDPPFADEAEKRAPSSLERPGGFPCGPADQALFNYMFNLLEGQITEVANSAGVTSNGDGDHTVLLRALQALIADIELGGGGGGGDTSGFVQFTQARSRLPIFPDIVGGRLTVTSPGAGQVRLASGGQFLHRGIWPITTTQEDFTTTASKSYHLRWRYNGGTPTYELLDLVPGGTYNPGSLNEANIAFDSTFDDMLIARVITNSSNIPTITTLANKAELGIEPDKVSGPTSGVTTLNWARLTDYLRGNTDYSARNRYSITGSPMIPGLNDIGSHVVHWNGAEAMTGPIYQYDRGQILDGSVIKNGGTVGGLPGTWRIWGRHHIDRQKFYYLNRIT